MSTEEQFHCPRSGRSSISQNYILNYCVERGKSDEFDRLLKVKLSAYNNDIQLLLTDNDKELHDYVTDEYANVMGG